jgi:hypothetical protein
MNFFKASTLLFAAATLAGCAGSAGPGIPSGITSLPAAPSGSAGSPAAIHHWVPMTTAFPLKGVSLKTLLEQQALGATIPFYTESVTSPLDAQTYTYSIVGQNPKHSNTTTKLTYVPIVLVIKYRDGTVLDPRKPSCADNVSVEDRFFRGPNFGSTDLVSNGIDVGTTQLGDGFQRAEFWKILKGQNYHTVLESTRTSLPVIVNVNAPSSATTETGVCTTPNHRVGLIPLLWYELEVQKIAQTYATTSQVPLILNYNTFLTTSTCCILGYHQAFQTSAGTHVLATAAYSDKDIFGSVPIEDIDVWTHEIGELLNDPFVNNATPAWGHVGQVTGCQNNLEVGDPLTGTAFTLDYNHFTYHPQELAFFSWFYRTKSSGTGGRDSFEGTFKTPQGTCS